jgi:hypothetical protein
MWLHVCDCCCQSRCRNSVLAPSRLFVSFGSCFPLALPRLMCILLFPGTRIPM